MKRWREENPDKARALHRRTYDRKRELIDSLKNVPCMDCGRSFPPECMDFDHRDPSAKLFAIGRAAGSGKGGEQAIRDEAAKCDVVCANCHRIRTRKQQAA